MILCHIFLGSSSIARIFFNYLTLKHRPKKTIWWYDTGHCIIQFFYSFIFKYCRACRDTYEITLMQYWYHKIIKLKIGSAMISHITRYLPYYLSFQFFFCLNDIIKSITGLFNFITGHWTNHTEFDSIIRLKNLI